MLHFVDLPSSNRLRQLLETSRQVSVGSSKPLKTSALRWQSLETDPLTRVPQSFVGVQFSILTCIDTTVPLYSLFKKTPAVLPNQSDHV